MSRPTQTATYRAPRRFLFASLGAALLAVAAAGTARAQCVGDCDGNCDVGISELIRGVNISLGSATLDTCPAFDADGDGMVAINELIRGVGNALGGCGEQCVANGSPSPTPTPTTGTTGTPETQTPGTVTPGTPTVTPPATSIATATRTTAPTPGGGLVLAGANALDTSTLKATFNGAVETASGLDITNYAISEMDPQIAGGPQVVAAHFVLVCDGGNADGMLCNDAVDPSRGDDSRCPGGQCSTEDHRSVLLSTGAHSTRKYKLTVTGVRDTAGNTIIIGPLGDRRNEWSYDGKGPETILYCPKATAAHTLATGRCEPVRCTAATGCGPGCNGGVNADLACQADSDCPGSTCGTLPCIAAIPDCDGDGLQDDREAEGWQVVVTTHPDPIGHPDMTTATTRRVTSNPLRVDTDNDGLSDKEEFKSGLTGSVSDPRNRDTDGDLLDDYQEVVLLRSNPANDDSDADGVTDFVEVNQNGSSPSNPDSDGDSITDGADYGANGGDPRLADLPGFRILVDSPKLSYNYDFVFKSSQGETKETGGTVSATLSDMSSDSSTTTDTTVREWSVKAALHAETSVAYPGVFEASAKLTLDADVGASGKNEVTGENAKKTVQERQKSDTHMHSLMSGETVERTVDGATASATVRFFNTGPFALCLDKILVQMRAPDPQNPGEFIPLGTLEPPAELGQIVLAPGHVNNTATVQFSAMPKNLSADSIDRLMRNPRSIIFDVGSFLLYSDPTGNTGPCEAGSYARTQQNIVQNTGEVTIDFAGENNKPVKHFFVSSNLGRREAVRDLNGDNKIDARDAEQVIYTPDGTFRYPRLTDALRIAGFDEKYSVDPTTGHFTSIDGVANLESPHRKAWIILVRNGQRTDSRTSDVEVAFDPTLGVDDVAITPGVQVWITYLQDEDNDGVARPAEDLYGTSDDNPDSDGDTVSDFDEIYKSVPVAVTDIDGQVVKFEAHSNPVLKDSDFDNVPDDVERANHTAPDRRDTDGDGLPDDTDPDPLVYGCVPHTFRFQLTSTPVTIGGSTLQVFLANDYTQTAKPGCSVTIHTPEYVVTNSAQVQGSTLSVKAMTGYGSCRFTNCAIDFCTGSPPNPDLGGTCSLDQDHQPDFACNGFGVNSVGGSYYLECGN